MSRPARHSTHRAKISLPSTPPWGCRCLSSESENNEHTRLQTVGVYLISMSDFRACVVSVFVLHDRDDRRPRPSPLGRDTWLPEPALYGALFHSDPGPPLPRESGSRPGITVRDWPPLRPRLRRGRAEGRRTGRDRPVRQACPEKNADFDKRAKGFASVWY